MGDLGSLFGSYEPPSFSYASEIQPCESDNCSYSTLTVACVLCFNFTHERHYRTLIKVASLAEDYWSHNVLCATHPQPLLQSNRTWIYCTTQALIMMAQPHIKEPPYSIISIHPWVGKTKSYLAQACVDIVYRVIIVLWQPLTYTCTCTYMYMVDNQPNEWSLLCHASGPRLGWLP